MLTMPPVEQILRKSLERLRRSSPRQKAILGVSAFLIGCAIFLPLVYGTSTYPVAIVQGNSMYPNLQNGDMVFFRGIKQNTVPNGTIIVFVQSDTGIGALDSLLKPIIIHRVVGSFAQSDGALYYVTKGDNNQFNDPSAVRADHILGTPVQVVPKAGLLMLFFSSPQGLVALIGFITLFYLGDYEGKLSDERKRETFLGAVANMVINEELPEEAFKKFELAVKYVSREQLEQIRGALTRALLDWLRKRAKEKYWSVSEISCPRCDTPATSFEGSTFEPFIVCPQCLWKRGLIQENPIEISTEAE